MSALAADDPAQPGGAAVPLPPIRFRAIPDREPPLLAMHELEQALGTPHQPSPYVQGTLAVDFRLGHCPTDDDEVDFGPQPTPSGLLPEPGPWSERLASAVLEVVDGVRPPTQLLRWSSPEVYDALSRRHLRSVRRRTDSRHEGRPDPNADPPHPVAGHRRPLVRRVVVCQPADGVAEVSVVAQHGGRVRALALRLEGLDHRWVLTVVQIG